MNYSELQQYHAHAKALKLTAAQAIAAILNDPKTDDLEPATLQALAFLVGKGETKAANKKDINNPFWLAAQFMAKKDVRLDLNFIYANGTELVASNGHVLIKIPHEVEPGYYNPSGNMALSIDEYKYPNFDRVYNQPFFDDKPLNLTKPHYEKMTDEEIPCPTVGWNINGNNEIWFKKQYIDLLLKIGVKQSVISTNYTALKFETDRFSGIVMPISA